MIDMRERQILLATTGESPQVVTETLFALHEEAQPWPDEIYLITTTLGKSRAAKGLLQEGHLARLCEEVGKPLPEFDINNILVVPDAQGAPIDDARKLEDHEAMANFIMTRVRDFTAEPSQTVHASLAGGRKTMTFYLGYAMSLFGRSKDRLSHVLVSEKHFEGGNFWYPTKAPEHRYIRNWRGDPVLDSQGVQADAANARVNLADIPFLRHRHKLPPLMQAVGANIDFRELVELINLGEDPLRMAVTVDCRRRSITVSDRDRDTFTPVVLTLNHIEFAFYLIFARAVASGQESIQSPSKAEPSEPLLKIFLDELLPLLGLEPEETAIDSLDVLEDWHDEAPEGDTVISAKTLSALRGVKTVREGAVTSSSSGLAEKSFQETEKQLRNAGMPYSWFHDRRTDMKNIMQARLPESIAIRLLPNRKGKNQHAVQLTSANLTIIDNP